MLRSAYNRLRDLLVRAESGWKLVVPHLEVHVTHQCNLTCEGCLHFMNHGHRGMHSLEALRQSMSLWNKRLLPKSFSLLGGEPTLHKDLVAIVRMTREMWPSRWTELSLVTNGLLLHRHPGLPRALADTRTRLDISIHGDATTSPKYQEGITASLELARKWQSEFGIEFEIDPNEGWKRGYQGFGEGMRPFEDGNPQASWDNCVTGQECFQLFENCLWKCAPSAYLGLQSRKFRLSEKWAPYLAYQPLRPESSDRELAEFFRRKAEPLCGMCPGRPEVFRKKDPLLPLKYYEKSEPALRSPG